MRNPDKKSNSIPNRDKKSLSRAYSLESISLISLCLRYDWFFISPNRHNLTNFFSDLTVNGYFTEQIILQ